MSKKDEVVYAKLDTSYRDLVVPMHLLEQILRESYLVRMSFQNDEYVIEDIKRMNKAEFITETEVNQALAQSKLEGKL